MKNFIYYSLIVITVALAAVCGYFTVMQSGSVSSSLITYIVSLLICYELSLQSHECGHKLFGLFVGVDVKLKPDKLFSDSLGCEISPRHGTDIKVRYVVTAVGGLVVNLALLIVGIVFCFMPYDTFGTDLGVVIIVLRALMPTSFYIFAINALPLEYSSGKTDSLAIIQALRGDDEWKVAEAILTVQGTVNSGLQLKDVEEETLLNVPQLPEDNYYFIVLTQLRYEYYKARGDVKKADFYKKRYDEIKKYL